MEYLLADTGFWYAIFDPRDPYYAETMEKTDLLEIAQIVLPWPTLYETLRTRFVRNRLALRKFELFLKKSTISFLDDAPYRAAAFEHAFEYSLRKERPLSMVDSLIRLIIEDVNVKIHYLATFNKPDFIDVCNRYQVEIF